MNSHRSSHLAVLGFLFAALVSSTAQSLWYDELFTVWTASRPWSDLVHQANLDGFTPPLFYVLVKLLSEAGLRLEALRVLPVILGGLGAFLALEACHRLFGPHSRVAALCIVCGSAYLFTFAHELRPYSALLACAFFFLGRLGGPGSAHDDSRAAGAALLATSLSYLGVMMVIVWLVECRRRASKKHLAGVSAAALILCFPGLAKLVRLSGALATSTIVRSVDPPSLSATFFGLSPFPRNGWTEGVALTLLGALLWKAYRTTEVPAFGFLLRALLFFIAMLLSLDAMVGLGPAPRYAALPMSALLLLLVGVLSGSGRTGLLIVALLSCLNGLAVLRYLTVLPQARENWREAMSRIDVRLGPEGVLLAFPFHHAAMAASAYAPGLVVGGGYTSRDGPVYWYEPPASFRGYGFGDLEKLGDPAGTLRLLVRISDVCLMSDEPDSTKTDRVFALFESLGGAEKLDTGDPRLRAACRAKSAPQES